MIRDFNFKYFIFLLGLFILFLFANYILGTQAILEAHQHKFHGGVCGGCQTCFDYTEICQKKSGFDLGYLYLSLFLFNFILGISYTIRGKRLISSLGVSFLATVSFMIVAEVVIKIFKIPVLYTHFMEGKQSLSYQAFLRLTSRISWKGFRTISRR